MFIGNETDIEWELLLEEAGKMTKHQRSECNVHIQKILKLEQQKSYYKLIKGDTDETGFYKRIVKSFFLKFHIKPIF